jgi:hypothetical protein
MSTSSINQKHSKLHAPKTPQFFILRNYSSHQSKHNQSSKSSFTKVLCYIGKILADTDTLETYKIENDHTLIAVCSTPESKPPTQPTQFTQPSQPSPMNMPPFIPPMSTGGQNPGNPLGVPMSPYGSNPAAMMQNPMFKVMMQSVLMFNRCSKIHSLWKLFLTMIQHSSN